MVSKTVVIDGGLGSSPRNFLVIFIRTSAILCKINWYKCLDIMPLQEGMLPILKHIYLNGDVQCIVIYIDIY